MSKAFAARERTFARFSRKTGEYGEGSTLTPSAELSLAHMRGLIDGFGSLGYSSILLDAEGRLLDVGQGAEAAFNEFFYLSEGRIRGRRSEHASILKRLLCTVSIDATGESHSSTSCFESIRRQTGQPILIQAMPLRDPNGRVAATILSVIDLEQVRVLSDAVLRETFGLTLAEARLASRVFQGETLRDISEKDNVRVSTLRTQLAAIFSKTRTNRQAELVMLMSRLAAVWTAHAAPSAYVGRQLQHL